MVNLRVQTDREVRKTMVSLVAIVAVVAKQLCVAATDFAGRLAHNGYGVTVNIAGIHVWGSGNTALDFAVGRIGSLANVDPSRPSCGKAVKGCCCLSNRSG